MKYLLAIMVLFALNLFAENLPVDVVQAPQVASSPVPQVSPAPSVVPGQQVADKIDQVTAKVPKDVASWFMYILSFLLSSELVLRAVPTFRPKSLFLGASVILKSIAGLMEAIAALLDKLLQNLK